MLEIAVQIKIVQIKVHLRGLYRYYKGHLMTTEPTLWRRASEEVSRSFSNQYLIKQMSFLLVIINMQHVSAEVTL